MLSNQVLNILLGDAIQPPESNASGFAASNDTSGLPAGEYNVTGPNFDFYNNFWNVILKQLL